MPRKATPLQTVQAYKDMGTINYQSGQNVDTWLDLLKEYNANPSAYPDGYAWWTDCAIVWQKPICLMI